MIDKIEAIICAGEEINPYLLHTEKQTKECCIPRQIIMYFAKDFTDMTYKEIGDYFNRNHATVTNSVKHIENIRDTEPSFRRKLRQYEKAIKDVDDCTGTSIITIMSDKIKKDMDDIAKKMKALQELVEHKQAEVERLTKEATDVVTEPIVEVTDCATKFERPFAGHPVRSTAFDGYIQHNL